MPPLAVGRRYFARRDRSVVLTVQDYRHLNHRHLRVLTLFVGGPEMGYGCLKWLLYRKKAYEVICTQ